MPKLFNLDHQPVVLDWNEHVVVQPGESHEFTDEEVAAGLAGLWGEEDPRAGLKAEREFKRKRDAKGAAKALNETVVAGDESTKALVDATQTTEPAAEPESKE